jgi:hypothetical protein
MPFEVLENEPRFNIERLVQEIAGRRDDALEEMQGEFKSLILGLVDQFAAMKKHDPDLSLRSIELGTVRWVREGRLVIDISYKGKPFAPRVARWD